MAKSKIFRCSCCDKFKLESGMIFKEWKRKNGTTVAICGSCNLAIKKEGLKTVHGFLERT